MKEVKETHSRPDMHPARRLQWRGANCNCSFHVVVLCFFAISLSQSQEQCGQEDPACHRKPIEAVCASEDEGVDFTCVTEKLESEEALEWAFGASPVQFRTERRFLSSKLAPLPRDVTLCTQGSVDRLGRLKEQAQSWGGSLSVAIFMRPQEAQPGKHEQILAQIRDVHEYIESLGRCRLTISLVYGLDKSQARIEFDTLYPINALRNVAVREAPSELIMVIDIDFIPSAGFWEFCTEPQMYDTLLSRAVNEKHVWALVSLELHEGYLDLPLEKQAMAECLQNKSVVVAETYLNPAAHIPVHIEEWLQRAQIYGPLETSDAFEPFVLGGSSVLPLYDERFRGYGWDKTTHANQLRALGFAYYMLPQHFVIARYHQPTQTAVRVFGGGEAGADQFLRMRMEWLYNRFITELEEDPALVPALS